MAGRPRGPLDGVPVTVKDLMDLAGFPTRRGSRLTDPRPAAQDSPVPLSLKEAGAVILGKTTTTEFGWKRPGIARCTASPATRGTWRARRADRVRAQAQRRRRASARLHVGTDAGGSIRIPAAYCGIVGVKPTYGRVPQWPHGAFAAVAVAGPMARTVRDAALLLQVMARPDARDPYALDTAPPDLLAGIEAGVGGLRIALVRRFGYDPPLDTEGEAALVTAAEVLREAGAEVEEADPALPDTRAIFSRVWGRRWPGWWRAPRPDRRALLDPGLLEVAADMEGTTAADMLEADALRGEAAHRMAMFHLRYDLVLTAATPTAAFPADQPTREPLEALWREWAPWTFAANLTRQPAVAVPVGLDAEGMPRAVQILAAQGQDGLALRAARVIEQAARVGVPAA